MVTSCCPDALQLNWGAEGTGRAELEYKAEEFMVDVPNYRKQWNNLKKTVVYQIDGQGRSF